MTCTAMACAIIIAAGPPTQGTITVPPSPYLTIDNSRVLSLGDSWKPTGLRLYGASISEAAIFSITGTEGKILIYGREPRNNNEIVEALKDFAKKGLRDTKE